MVESSANTLIFFFYVCVSKSVRSINGLSFTSARPTLQPCVSVHRCGVFEKLRLKKINPYFLKIAGISRKVFLFGEMYHRAHKETTMARQEMDWKLKNTGPTSSSYGFIS